MRIVRTPRAMRALAAGWRRRGQAVGLVPTMGALHRGHAELIRRARRENARAVVSVFVNPLQFGPKEDLKRYPRPFAADAALCRRLGVDALYHPSPAAMVPPGFATQVAVAGVSGPLEGERRPGHFEGVATVVLKLFNACLPDRAYFGEKDYQQLQVVRRMVRDLDLGLTVVACPTVREADGLALSSRNIYLDEEERLAAPLLYKGLAKAAALARKGVRDARALERAARAEIARIGGARVDYVSVADPATLAPLKRVKGRARILAAVRVGRTRLIDNRGL